MKPTKNDKVVRFFLTPQVKQTSEGQVHLRLRTLGVTKKRTTMLFLSAYNWYILNATQLVFYLQLYSRNHTNQIIKVPIRLMWIFDPLSMNRYVCVFSSNSVIFVIDICFKTLLTPYSAFRPKHQWSFEFDDDFHSLKNRELFHKITLFQIFIKSL